jgi:protein-disulfide isomerase
MSLSHHPRLNVVITACVAAVCAVATCAAQAPSAAAPAVDQQILTELQQIRSLLQQLITLQLQPGSAPRPAAPPSEIPVTLTSVTGAAIGSKDAPVTIVEFTDLLCPFCRQFHNATFEQLKRDYIDTGKVRFVTRDFPIDQLHPMATAAARANRCAGEQQRFWEMRHALLGVTTPLTAGTFSQLAGGLGLDVARFEACAGDASRFKEELQKDRQDGIRIGVSATPSFVIGRTLPGGGVDGILAVGARPYAAFDARLKQLLLPAQSSR